MVDKLGVNNGTHELKLGKSFTKDDPSFHTFRYDFKPASVDKSKIAEVEIGERSSATVTVPHIDGAGQTVYKGNKKPVQKECILIIDHQTGEITLEKVSNAFQLKKTRTEGAKPQISRPSTPVDKPRPASKAEHVQKTEHHSSNASKPSMPAVAPVPAVTPVPAVAPVPAKDAESMSGSSSDSDSSSSDDEGDKSNNVNSASPQKTHTSSSQVHGYPRKRTTSLLREDLDLSESGSDSE